MSSFLALNDQAALEQAAAVDKSLAAGERRGPLAGVPLAVKVPLLPFPILDLDLCSLCAISQLYGSRF